MQQSPTAAETKPRVISDASELKPDDRYCTHCKKPLKGKVAWLELDQRTGSFHDKGGVPDNKSQGWFPFGGGCARTLLKEHAIARAEGR